MVEVPKAEYRYELYGRFTQIFSEPMICVTTSTKIELGTIYDDFLNYIRERLPKNQKLSIKRRNADMAVISSGLEIFTFYCGNPKETEVFNLESHLEPLQSPQIGLRKKQVIHLLREYGERLVQLSGK